MTTSSGLESMVTPHGISIAKTPKARDWPDCVMAQFKTAGETGMLFGVVELYDDYIGYPYQLVQLCRTPLYSGLARVGVIVSGGVLEGKICRAKISGFAVVAYQGSALNIGQRLGCRAGTQYAQPDDGGPFIVVHIPDEYADALTGLAVVEIIGRRLDSKIVNCDAAGGDGDGASGPYYTIIYADSAGTPIETSPGKLETS